MKRRVVQGKENKRCHRALHAAFNAKPPLLIVVDASVLRAYSELKGAALPGLATMAEDGLEAEVDVRFCPATRTVLQRTAPEAERLLGGALHEYRLGGTTAEQNEAKAVISALSAPRTEKYPVVFLLSLNHDIRRVAAKVPRVGLLNFAIKERRVRFDQESVSSLVRTGYANGRVGAEAGDGAEHAAHGLSAADAAFMRKLAAERLIPESAAPPSTRPVSSTAEGDAPAAEEPVLSKAQLAELQAKKAVREKRQQKLQLRKQKAHDAKKSHANPMSAKKKKQKFSYHASSAAD
jgi:hypothetical protein